MNKASLKDMVGGWFVGHFSPTVMHSDAFEVAIKRYAKGAHEARHMHKVATEITVIVSGKVEMSGIIYEADDIITIAPYEATDFVALEDTITVVLKTPSVKNDKYVTNA